MQINKKKLCQTNITFQVTWNDFCVYDFCDDLFKMYNRY